MATGENMVVIKVIPHKSLAVTFLKLGRKLSRSNCLNNTYLFELSIISFRYTQRG